MSETNTPLSPNSLPPRVPGARGADPDFPRPSAGEGLRVRDSRRKVRKKNAQSLVEFAMVLPTLLLLLFASIDFGWILFNYVSLDNGLREGLRYASVTGYSGTAQYCQLAAIQNVVIAQAGLSGVQSNNIDVTYDHGDPGTTLFLGTCPGLSDSTTLSNGDRVVVEIGCPPTPLPCAHIPMYVHFLTPFISTFAPQGMLVHLKSARSIFPVGF